MQISYDILWNIRHLLKRMGSAICTDTEKNLQIIFNGQSSCRTVCVYGVIQFIFLKDM